MADAAVNVPSTDTDDEEGLAAVKGATNFNIAEAFQKASRETQRSPLSLAVDFAKASLGKAKLSQDDFFRYRIYDKVSLSAEERDAFIGQAAINATNHSINQAMTVRNIVDDKIMYCAALRALGLNAPVLQIMVSADPQETAYRVVAGAEAFAAFLRNEARYPLFGKPDGGSLSRGAASFDRYDAASDKLIDVTGKSVDPDEFAAEVISEFGADGYLIEDRVIPHPELQEVSGQTVGTVRIFTLNYGDGPQPLYAVWKIPSFDAVADNLWRSGNMVGEIDMETGKVLCVRFSGIDGEMTFDAHRDSGARLLGRTLPDWEEAKSAVRRAATLTPHIPGIGFDLALSDQGPLIIEGNTLPNHGLYQTATGRGFMTSETRDLVERAITRSKKIVENVAHQQKKGDQRSKDQSKSTSKANVAQGLKTAMGQQDGDGKS